MAAVKLAKQLGPGHRIVTLLCDRSAFDLREERTSLIFRSGARHLSKFWADTEPVGGAEDDISLDEILQT